jgi:hypothetical protein
LYGPLIIVEIMMEASWNSTIAALGAAAGELAAAQAGEAQPRLMLQALGRELHELVTQTVKNTPRATARALLLTAERAVKVAEMAAGLHGNGDQHLRGVATGAIQLAQTLASSAHSQAAALLPQIADEELRANFAQEFAAHAKQAEALAAQLEPTA